MNRRAIKLPFKVEILREERSTINNYSRTLPRQTGTYGNPT